MKYVKFFGNIVGNISLTFYLKFGGYEPCRK
jgi:hypothetical protein